jgi:hypothetical protein
VYQRRRVVQITKLCRRIKETGREKVKWIHLALDRNKWRGLINTVMNPYIHEMGRGRGGGYSVLPEILFSVGQLLS